MKSSLDDPTKDKRWLDEQIDRLLAFELLSRILRAQYQPLEATTLADKTGLNRSVANKIINNLRTAETINNLRTTINDY